MSGKLFKYKLVPDEKGICFVNIPSHSSPLSVGFQGEDLFLWARVIEGNELALNIFVVVPTGGTLPDYGTQVFIGTAHTETPFSRLVFHVFQCI